MPGLIPPPSLSVVWLVNPFVCAPWLVNLSWRVQCTCNLPPQHWEFQTDICAVIPGRSRCDGGWTGSDQTLRKVNARKTKTWHTSEEETLMLNTQHRADNSLGFISYSNRCFMFGILTKWKIEAPGMYRSLHLLLRSQCFHTNTSSWRLFPYHLFKKWYYRINVNMFYHIRALNVLFAHLSLLAAVGINLRMWILIYCGRSIHFTEVKVLIP